MARNFGDDVSSDGLARGMRLDGLVGPIAADFYRPPPPRECSRIQATDTWNNQAEALLQPALPFETGKAMKFEVGSHHYHLWLRCERTVGFAYAREK